MKQLLRKISFLLIFSLTIPYFSYTVSAAENKTAVKGIIYEFEENSEYNISTAETNAATGSGNTLGTFSILGGISSTSTKGGVPAYEVKDGELLKFSYTYDDALLNANEDEWHLIDDGKNKVDGIDLGDKINYGAIILQTSLDGEKWYTNQIQTNVFQETPEQSDPFYDTIDIQLMNGCYYRIIVAYKTQIKTESSNFLFIDTSSYEYKKYAEVYEFYAGYKGADSSFVSGNENRFALGALVNTGKDNGYSGENTINSSDPHYGWELGNFFISGYTDKTDEQVFLKNVGDKVTLWFNLKQDITALNGNENLSVDIDKDGYDQYFQTKKTDFGHGTLIVRYTNHEGVKQDPIIYTNYLEALSSAGAYTKIQLFEEGDYEVALDYKIKDSSGWFGSANDYRISFTFKVRNGNCMVYPFDVATNAELTNSSVTKNGFRLDLAKSRYLKINVTMARWTKGENGYVEDIRFNRPAKDGEQYTDEGIYTIEVSNIFTGSTTTKRIYVGADNILIAYVNENNAKYTINEISELVEQGAEIKSDGTIVLPVSEPVTETTTATEAVTETVTTTAETEPPVTEIVEVEPETKESSVVPFIVIGVVVVVIVAGAVLAFVMVKARRKKKDEPEQEQETEKEQEDETE